jgi:hypothetical protein
MSFDPCICRHHRCNHVFVNNLELNESESICAVEGCNCKGFDAWEVILIDPRGVKWKTNDVQRFARVEHRELFLPEDLEVKHCPGGGEFTNADRGLHCIIHRGADSWKDWAVMVFPKTYRP